MSDERFLFFMGFVIGIFFREMYEHLTQPQFPEETFPH